MSRDVVIVADDDPDFRELVRLLIEGTGASVCEAATFEGALDVARSRGLDVALAIVDYFMPGDRARVVPELRRLLGDERVALCTASAEPRARAAELGLSRVFPKPIEIDAVRDVVARLRNGPD